MLVPETHTTSTLIHIINLFYENVYTYVILCDQLVANKTQSYKIRKICVTIGRLCDVQPCISSKAKYWCSIHPGNSVCHRSYRDCRSFRADPVRYRRDRPKAMRVTGGKWDAIDGGWTCCLNACTNTFAEILARKSVQPSHTRSKRSLQSIGAVLIWFSVVISS